MNVFAVLSGNREYSMRVSGGLSAKSRIQFRDAGAAGGRLVGFGAVTAALSARVSVGRVLSVETALSLFVSVARVDESARTESARAESRTTESERMTLSAPLGAGVRTADRARPPRHPATVTTTATAAISTRADIREEECGTRYLVGILTGARALHARRHLKLLSRGSDSKPMPVN